MGAPGNLFLFKREITVTVEVFFNGENPKEGTRTPARERNLSHAPDVGGPFLIFVIPLQISKITLTI